MLAADILPDLATMLPRVEFLQHLSINVEVPGDQPARVEIRLQADGVEIPTSGEITMPDVNS
jgi:hypothetical protein